MTTLSKSTIARRYHPGWAIPARSRNLRLSMREESAPPPGISLRARPIPTCGLPRGKEPVHTVRVIDFANNLGLAGFPAAVGC